MIFWILLALGGGFVAGILVGRKNKTGVEKILAEVQAELAALKAKYGNK